MFFGTKFKEIDLDLIVYTFLLLFAPLFFFNLSGFSLVDFDEAWWAEVARQILVRTDPLLMYFNESPMFFHPPFGYILIAISQLIFGTNEIASRLPSAVLGFGSLFLLYEIGKKLFNKFVGIGAALTLVSCVWFVFRARSGNLDTIFLFMTLLTFYCFTLTEKNKKFLYFSAVSFSLLMLTKTLIGVFILIPIFVYFLLHHKKLKVNFYDLIKTTFVATIVLAPYLFVNYVTYGTKFLDELYANAVKPGQQYIPSLHQMHKTSAMLNLHYGIREWYYPGILAMLGSLVFLKKYLNVLVVYAWIIPLLTAFIINPKTEIWHLIPLYAPIGLIAAFFVYGSIPVATSLVGKLTKAPSKNIQNILICFAFLGLLSFSLKQIFEFKNEISLFGKSRSGLAVVSEAARGRPEPLFLDNDNFLPSPVFYSHKKVLHIRIFEAPKNTLKGFLENGVENSMLITEKWRINTDKIDENSYKIIKEHEGHVLILTNL